MLFPIFELTKVGSIVGVILSPVGAVRLWRERVWQNILRRSLKDLQPSHSVIQQSILSDRLSSQLR